MTFLRRWLPVLAWSGVIFLFSSWETPPATQDTLLNFIFKKTAHLVEYAILYYLAYRAFSDGPSIRALATRPDRKGRGREQVSAVRGRSYFYPLIFTILYAVSDEIHQSFVPDRHGRIYDVAIDTAGALIVLARIKYAVLKSPLEPKDKDKIVTLNQRWSGKIRK